MLQEAIDLQQNAVSTLVRVISQKNEITFRAPTGSGKTHMIADFMNRILIENKDVVFLVSSLSKGGLAKQNYEVFKRCSDQNIFSNINPFLVTSESGNEERLFIPKGYNVYVLPRDLYKKNSKLKDEGVLLNFLMQMTHNIFGNGESKKIWLIKDECHQATNNLNELQTEYFEKVINFSATPNLKRKQHIDVEISDDEAEKAKLIKRIELDTEENLSDNEKGKNPEIAIKKFLEIKENYRNLLGVNPCLIIQISNKDKAEQEWLSIKRALSKTEFQGLKWMSIFDDPKKCETNDKLCKLNVARWKDYAKENSSTIDVIIFKMVISEGWDIPRACMLYQIRDSKSEQLNEQVIGRVRRNPRLIDFETLSLKAQELAMTAWVWGNEPKTRKLSRQVKLFGNENDIPNAIKLKTTHLIPPTYRKDFDVEIFLNSKPIPTTTNDIFTLYNKLQKNGNDVSNLCYEYAKNDIQKWWKYCDFIEEIRKEYENCICDYSNSMELVKDNKGKTREISFPLTSSYLDSENYSDKIFDWVWKRNDGNNKFSFDSEAEREWVSILKEISSYIATQETGIINKDLENIDMFVKDAPKRKSDERKKLWGKNFISGSEIKYEYYLNGIHQSYPDFILKDNKGKIHLFEVKSVNNSNKFSFDSAEYENKIRALKLCYKYCSEMTGHIFYLPILKNDKWQITRYIDGEESVITDEEFIKSFQ